MSVQWVIAIGTGILAVVALFQHHIKSWFTTPSLLISAASATPYCKKLLFIHPSQSTVTADGYALRIAVKNTTPRFRIKSRAEEVEVFLSKLDRKAQDGRFHHVQGFEPANLMWSHSYIPFAPIAPDMERYCFIGRALKPSQRENFPDFDNPSLPKDETCFRLDVQTPRHTKEHIIPPGKYRLECLIGGANTKSTKEIFEITISADWFDNEVKMYEKGLSIEMIKQKQV